MPEPGPFGETFFEARLRAMVAASLVNNPSGGWVESVVTRATHRLLDFLPALLEEPDTFEDFLRITCPRNDTVKKEGPKALLWVAATQL